MKTLTNYLIIITVVFNIQCSAQNHTSDVWVIRKIKTNYVQRGVNDKYELPNELKGKRIQIQDSAIILAVIYKYYKGLALNDEFGDSIFFNKKIYFKRCEDDNLNIQYPGNEFLDCITNIIDTCNIGGTFLTLLGVKEDGINALVSISVKHSKSRCILFILKKNKEVVLYSENDSLLLFLSKEK